MSITNSKGVNKESCKGVNYSDGVNGSYGVNESNSVNWSYGVNWSDGVNWSKGVNYSYGVLNSFGVDNAIFLADKKRTFSIFDKEVSEERFNEVWSEIYNKANNWYPKFNNAFELYLKNGNDWEKVNASEIKETLEDWKKPYEAWKDMPKELLSYIKSLEEFNSEMFKTITGIDTDKKEEQMITLPNGKKVSMSTVVSAIDNLTK